MSAATRIVRSFGSGNQKKWTMSFWMKVSRINYTDGGGGNSRQVFGQTLSNYCRFIITGSTQKIQFYESQGMDLRPSMTFNDPNAWYHVVVAVDTAQATASNRVKIYINGVQQTAFDTETYPGQNVDLHFNKSGTHDIGGSSAYGGYDYFNGLLSHVHLTDGYAYAASDFGSTDSTTGEWKINTSPSVSYGTTGYWILKDGNGLTDQSPNSNDWTLSTGTLTKTEDNPSNVFATMNPLDNYYQSSTFTEGNNTVEHGQSAWTYNTSTLKIPEATKFYCEGKVIAMNQNTCGIASNVTTGSGGSNTALPNITGGVGFRGNQGDVLKATSTQSGTWATFTTNDIIQIACDTVNNKLYFGKNGTWLNSGDPTSGASGTGAISINDNTDYFFAFGDNTDSARGKWSINFGNGYFGTTAVSSAGTNASNNGIFEYDVPTGYTALSTKGLNL